MNKPHKHIDLIIAWANGAEIEHRRIGQTTWFYSKDPQWKEDEEYRIKQEPKPDVVKYGQVHLMEDLNMIDRLRVRFFDFRYDQLDHHNLELTFDGETMELYFAKVIK